MTWGYITHSLLQTVCSQVLLCRPIAVLYHFACSEAPVHYRRLWPTCGAPLSARTQTRIGLLSTALTLSPPARSRCAVEMFTAKQALSACDSELCGLGSE